MSTQEDPFHLPRLLNACASPPVLSKDGGAERNRRRVDSLTTDKTAKDLSPRREAFIHRSVSPRPAEKQQISLNIKNEWFSETSSKAELAEGEAENNKESTRLENYDPLLWSSDDDDDDADEDDETRLHSFVAQNEKKLHSLEEIQHTRYLRMKSAHHWLPKTGNVPKNLLSASIIVGHTKAVSLDEEDRSCAENEDGEMNDSTEQCKTIEKGKNGHEMNKGSDCNYSQLEEFLAV